MRTTPLLSFSDAESRVDPEARQEAQVLSLVDLHWPSGEAAVAARSLDAAGILAGLEIAGEMPAAERAAQDRRFLLLAILLTTAQARTRDDVIRLCAAVGLMRRAHALHADVRVLDGVGPSCASRGAPATSRSHPHRPLVVLAGDRFMTGAFELLVGLRSMAALKIFADASVTIVEASMGRLEHCDGGSARRPAVHPKLFEALARGLSLLDATACDEASAAHAGSLFARTYCYPPEDPARRSASGACAQADVKA